MKDQFIAMHRQDYPISTMCRVLQVSVSGYYAWHKRAPSQRSWEDALLSERIECIYGANRQVYGSPRIHAALHADGHLCGKKRVARLLRRCGISAKAPRHRSRTTDSRHAYPVAEDVFSRLPFQFARYTLYTHLAEYSWS
jgi:putative transposase